MHVGIFQVAVTFTVKVDVHPTALHVLDGGALLQKVRWNANSTFKELCFQYVNHVKKNHGVSKIVFDGYSDKPSTKDHEHTRRTVKRKGSAGPQHTSGSCIEENKVLMKQDKFLLSGENKSRFIDMLSGYLTRAGNDVVQCKNDADTEMVKCALDVAKTGRRVNVVADDTDVALLLLYHCEEEMADVSFTSERSKATFDICYAYIYYMSHTSVHNNMRHHQSFDHRMSYQNVIIAMGCKRFLVASF